MFSPYRPQQPDKRGRSRHVMRISKNPQSQFRIKILDPAGQLDDKISLGASRIDETGISAETVRGCVRGGLRFFDHFWHKLAASSSPLAFTPWGCPRGVRELFKECLRALKATVRESTNEKNVWHIEAEDEDLDDIVQMVSGVFHLYEAFSTIGVYRNEREPNPFEIPAKDRVARRVPGVGGNGCRTITPRFRFRIPTRAAAALVTDSPALVCLIIPALVAFNVPTSIVVMFKTMIEGLARISEQLRLTVWDWWKQSSFGSELATPNKGDGERRTKVQDFSAEHTADMQVWFDVERRELDPDGWGLDEWRKFMLDPCRTPGERRAKAMKSPLFPNAKGKFHTRSGVVDQWYRPAMKAAGLPTRTHYIRHAGVSSFMAHLRRRDDLSQAEKDAAALAFAKDMGWKWPERMLERYSVAERQAARIEVRRRWRQDRHKNFEMLLAGFGQPDRESVPDQPKDMACSKIMRHILKEAA